MDLGLFVYGLMLGAGFAVGVYVIEEAVLGLKKLTGRWIHFG